MFIFKNFITRPFFTTVVILMLGHIIYFWNKFAPLSLALSLSLLWLAGLVKIIIKSKL